MALPNARNQYLKTQIETASKEQLVVMLFDGIIRFTEQARTAITQGQIEDSHHALMRAQAIIMELICTVDKENGGEIASNLLSLHAYAFNCLIVCNMKKDVTKIDEVQKIYRDLREAWVGAMDSLGISSSSGKPATPAPAATTPSPAAVNPTAAPGNGIVAQAAAPAPATILAAGSTQLVAPAPAPQAAPVPPAVPAAPKATGYGMGRTAMLGASNPQTIPTAPKAAAPAPQQENKPAAAPASAKHNAMVNAYTARSIA